MGWSTIPKVITGVKALSKTGATSVSKWKKKAAMSKLGAKSFQLDQTMKKADANLKKTVDKAKNILEGIKTAPSAIKKSLSKK